MEAPRRTANESLARLALYDECLARLDFVMEHFDVSRDDALVYYKSDLESRRWPFLEVRELLETRRVNVPRVLGEACDDGFILVEDLGDDTLARYLEQHPESRERFRTKALPFT